LSTKSVFTNERKAELKQIANEWMSQSRAKNEQTSEKFAHLMNDMTPKKFLELTQKEIEEALK
jgi:hypothetical protein